MGNFRRRLARVYVIQPPISRLLSTIHVATPSQAQTAVAHHQRAAPLASPHRVPADPPTAIDRSGVPKPTATPGRRPRLCRRVPWQIGRRRTARVFGKPRAQVRKVEVPCCGREWFFYCIRTPRVAPPVLLVVGSNLIRELVHHHFQTSKMQCRNAARYKIGSIERSCSRWSWHSCHRRGHNGGFRHLSRRSRRRAGAWCLSGCNRCSRCRGRRGGFGGRFRGDGGDGCL